MKVVEFYSGIGGMHFALEESGVDFQICAAFDINTSANQVYQHNFPSVPIKGNNILGLTVAKLEKLDGNLWTMSPPCQPFTRQGKKQDVNDNRTSSFLHLLTLLRQMKNPPECIFLENVMGFEVSEARNQLLDVLEATGFTGIREYLLTPKQIGIPNSRLRYYLIASRSSSERSRIVENKFPNCKCENPLYDSVSPKVGDYLLNVGSEFILPESALGKQYEVLDIVTAESEISCCFTRAYSHYLEGTGSVLFPGNDWNELTESYAKARECEEPCEKAEILKGLKLRFFSPLEISRLMGFPPKFTTPSEMSSKQLYRVLGNSINVKVVARLFHFIFCTKA